METADAANGSKISAKLQTLGIFPSDLCLTCEQPCSEGEWNFSIEDGVKRGKGEKILQEKKFSKLGKVSYRRTSKRVSCT
ncbi:hypothetical protein SUGI_0182920 [Cryptomeria japonica]|nr:hypothetical protein SUGI_0182920 [Cryptomeria japonica]